MTNRFCRWGMHLPGAMKTFHRGANFTRCTECGASLIAGQDGWKNIPPGKKVEWRPRRPDELVFARLANHDQARLPFSIGRFLRAVAPRASGRARN